MEQNEPQKPESNNVKKESTYQLNAVIINNKDFCVQINGMWYKEKENTSFSIMDVDHDRVTIKDEFGVKTIFLSFNDCSDKL